MNFKINNTVSSNSNVELDDTLATKNVLVQTGYMNTPDYGIDDMSDKPMIDGLKKLQKDNGLKVDGVMKPGGETEKTLQTLSSQSKQETTEQKASSMRPPRHKPRMRKPELKDPNEPKDFWDDPKGFIRDYTDIVYGDDPAGASNDPDASYGYFRPEGHPHVVGRRGEEVLGIPAHPGSPAMATLEDNWPGMHTTGIIHDEVVDRMIKRGWTDGAANFPTMYPSYFEAQRREFLNLIADDEGPVPYPRKKRSRFD